MLPILRRGVRSADDGDEDACRVDVVRCQTAVARIGDIGYGCLVAEPQGPGTAVNVYCTPKRA